MAKLTKNRKDSLSKFDKDKLYSLEEASNIIKDFSSLKFDSPPKKVLFSVSNILGMISILQENPGG